MKKAVCLILILLCGGLVLLVYFSGKRAEEEEFYILPQHKSYVYEEGRRMSFEVYSSIADSLLRYPDKNQYLLKTENMTYTLEETAVEVYPQGRHYLIVISCDVPKPPQQELYEPAVKLEIINSKYTVTLFTGSLSILNPEGIRLLGTDTLYASYSYVDGMLELVGLNITFSGSYSRLSAVQIGGAVFGCLREIRKDMRLENETEIRKVIPSYNIEGTEEAASVELLGQTYFIPMVYSVLYPVRQGYIKLCLDDRLYYLDTFSFIVNAFEPDDYRSFIAKGEIYYA